MMAIRAAAVLLPPPEAPLRRPGGQGTERMDRLSALAICAADQALAGLGQRPPPERIGVAVGTAYGCHQNDEAYYRGVLAAGGRPEGASPRLFVYTLPSSPAGEIAIHHQLRGPALCESSGRAAGLLALGEAMGLLRDGQAEAMVVCAVDVGERDAAAVIVLGPSGGEAPALVVASGYCPGDPAEALRRAARDLPAHPGPAYGDDLAGAGALPWPVCADAERYPACSGAAGALACLAALWQAGEPGIVLACDPHGQAAAALLTPCTARAPAGPR